MSTRTREELVDDVRDCRPHVVLLGAGASRAAFPNEDANAIRLPLMNDFVEVLQLDSQLKSAGVSEPASRNFEEIYSDLHADPSKKDVREQLEHSVQEYFGQMQLPEEPTLYDYLVLSLRQKDVIATFNWDPFLWDACERNAHIARPPRLRFLHGNVRVGYCKACRSTSNLSRPCLGCGEPLNPTRLLFPVTQKDYLADDYSAKAWELVEQDMRQAFLFTAFGYGAPATDVEAISLLKRGWGEVAERQFEETEIIDIRDEAELRELWEPFIHSHHYGVHTDFFKSMAATLPRRSVEGMMTQLLDAQFITANHVPRDLSLGDLQDWFGELIDKEESTLDAQESG